jgi:hypothetical protein
MAEIGELVRDNRRVGMHKRNRGQLLDPLHTKVAESEEVQEGLCGESVAEVGAEEAGTYACSVCHCRATSQLRVKTASAGLGYNIEPLDAHRLQMLRQLCYA